MPVFRYLTITLLYKRITEEMYWKTISLLNNKGATRMNLALRMTKRQMLLLALIFVTLVVTALLVIHTASPGLWHTIVDTPDIISGWH
jgi:hypothetical protein